MEYEIVCRDAFAVAGVRGVTPEAGGVWPQLKADGGLKALRHLAGPDSPLLGLCFGFDAKGKNDNMVGFPLRSAAPDGCEVFRYPACRCFLLRGRAPGPAWGNGRRQVLAAKIGPGGACVRRGKVFEKARDVVR
ncbi:GyrI-like domain-containing protein [Anaerofilum sp. BX8]|uniref:GyrI-like domain-containing protein n=1 Tax=Anaerofilum hominis TaxID=2763016 RepID=A0A923KX45_9FIRM|nr:GyrI-like domain-containing protein [Anaerofilum hominis]MBC5580029.1 GyrI-like domain-containing protein [Anaerofilum hominis]